MTFFVLNCVLYKPSFVLLKFHHFLFKNAFCIKSRLTKTFSGSKLAFILRCVKSFVLRKFNNYFFKNEFCIKSRLGMTFFVLNCMLHRPFSV